LGSASLGTPACSPSALLLQHRFRRARMGFMSFQSFWEKVAKAKSSTKAFWHRGWKDRLICFRPISQMMPRCESRFADTADVEPQDGTHLHDDRPLLKHRSSVGFRTRQVRAAAETTAERAKDIGRNLAKNGHEASLKLRRRAEHVAMHIPSPSRGRTRSWSRYSEKCDLDVVALKEETFEGTCDDDGTIFEIGSDDEEENAFQTHPLGENGCSSPNLKGVLNTWGQPGCSPPKRSKLDGIDQAGSLRLGSLESLQCLQFPEEVSTPSTPSTFYMGTPRDYM